MQRISANYKDRLFETLLEIPGLDDPNNRNLLLRNLPPNPVRAINRCNAAMADLNNILNAVELWGQLDTGEWALVVLTKNALRLARGTESGRNLEILLAEIEVFSTNYNLVPIEEVVIGQDERLPVSFLERGLVAAKAVAKLLVPRIINGIPQEQLAAGSGWLIAPNLMITNYHVIEARDRRSELPATEADLRAQALKTLAWFNYIERNENYDDYGCMELVHFNTKLDYAVLRLADTLLSKSNKPLSNYGYLSVTESPPNLVRGNRLNIIQHPQGGTQHIAIRSNFYVDSLSTPEAPDRIRYLTDTEPGSSGSPVFNDDWKVIALHHAAIQVPETIYKGEVIKYNNQGILIHSILASLPEAVRQEIQEAQG